MSLRSYLFIAVILILNQSCDTHKKSQKVSITSVEEQEFNQWKLDRVAALTSPSGWLTITALIWLKEDKLSVGTADRYDVTIPYHASANFGTLHKRAENWYLTPAENSQITLDGKPIHEERLLNHDQSGKTNIVGYESLLWYIIKRENTYGVRVKDSLNQARFELKEISTFQYNSDFVFDAQVEWASENDSILITNAQGLVTSNKLKGWLKFQHDGRTHTISFIDGGEDIWFTVFGDETNSAETYGAGRFLYIKVPKGSESVQLDFNRAENPPCFHSAFATCPLPPKENQLKTRITAGETSDH